jgi:tetratricopeptide (TPR) repeat protein
MKKRNLVLKTSLGILTTFTAIQASAEIVLPKPSSMSKVTQRIGVTDFSVDYSSPAVKGRKVFAELVKYGEIWRTGANMCTVLSFNTPATIGDKEVPAGKYCLFTIPNKDSWTLILNGQGDQPGTLSYDQSKDVLRTEIKPTKTPLTERLTFVFSDFDDAKGTLNVKWDTTQVSIPLKVKTLENLTKNIDSLNSDNTAADYADAARYMFMDLNNSDKALELVDKSIDIEETWNNKWIKAQILAKKGMKVEARELAEESLKLGDETVFFKFFKPSIEKAVADWK